MANIAQRDQGGDRGDGGGGSATVKLVASIDTNMGTPQDNTARLVASMEATAQHTKRTAEAAEKIYRHTRNMNLFMTIGTVLICVAAIVWMFRQYYSNL